MTIERIQRKMNTDTPPHQGGVKEVVMMQKEIPMTKDREISMMQLKTARGQIDGIIKMIESGRYCIDISNQILSSQALLRKAQKHILVQHMNHCVLDAMNSSDPDEKIAKTNEIASLLDKLLEAK